MRFLHIYLLFRALLTAFSEKEIMRWPLIEQMYFKDLGNTYVYSADTIEGKDRWLELKSRVIEHVQKL